ncbi:MAG TPA: single-stranded DNA-binding protein [Chromatiales bacterium]|nr:single-stranded DNA-binding protein [Chromatiales bacterium]
MSSLFFGRGNVGQDPELREVEAGDGKRKVVTLRVYFDRPVPDGDGGFEDKGGFWMDVTVWGARAEQAARVLRKGARVAVSGRLVQRAWTDREGNERTSLEVVADSVDLDLARIEQVTWRESAGRGKGRAEAAASA